MHCTYCGKKIEADAKFCEYCGRAVEGTLENSSERLELAPNAETAGSGSSAAPDRAGKRGHKTSAIVAAVISVLVAAGLAVGFFVYRDMQDKEAHRTYPVSIKASAVDYDPATASPIPVEVKGTDFEGNSVCEKMLVSGTEGSDVELMRGSYTVVIAGSPISGDGTLFDTAVDAVNLVIGEDGEDAEDEIALPTLQSIPMENRTAEMVDAAYGTLIDFGYDANRSGELKTTADDAIAAYAAEQQRLAEEERQRAEAAAAAALAEKNERISQQATDFTYLWLDGWTFEGGKFTTFDPGDAYLNVVAAGSEAANLLPKGMTGTGLDANSPYIHGNASLNVYDIDVLNIEDNVATVQVRFYAAQNKVTQAMYDKMVAAGGQTRTYLYTFDDDYQLTKVAFA